MHLFTRQAVLAGSFGDAVEWASDIRAYASELLGTEIALWSATFGAPVGSVGWAIRVDGLAGVAANSARLLGDAGYIEKASAGRDFIHAPAEDALLQPVHGVLGSEPPPVGAVATVTQATIAGAEEQVMKWGVELSELVEGVIDTQVLFGPSMFGTYGNVTWIAVAEDATQADTMNGKLMASPEYHAKLGTAPGLFVPGSGHRSFLTRIA